MIFVLVIGGIAFYGLIKDEFQSNREERRAQRDVMNRVLVALETLNRNDVEQSNRLGDLGRLFDRIERRLSDPKPVQDNAPAAFRFLPSAFVSLAIAADPTKPEIRFPTNPAPPNPIPSPATDEPFPLQPDRMYVIESNVPLLLFETPDQSDIIGISKLEGPRSIFGKFADEPAGRNRLREFSAKHLYVVEPVNAGDVQLLMVPVGAVSEADARRIRLRIGNPRPPPDDTKPKPAPAPKPATARKLATVVIEETADTTAKRSEFFGSAELLARWKAKGHEPPTVVDQNVKDGKTRETPEPLKAYVNRSKGKSLPQLYLIDLDTRDVVYEGPMPDTIADFLKLLDRVGG